MMNAGRGKCLEAGVGLKTKSKVIFCSREIKIFWNFLELASFRGFFYFLNFQEFPILPDYSYYSGRVFQLSAHCSFPRYYAAPGNCQPQLWQRGLR